ncbi:MAG: response regulator [Nitrospiraceae bacterium]|nr:response regulator [Nitrospiraceae bacterium]
MLLEEEGYEVAEAGDGETGSAMFHADPFDIVVIDMVMPGKGGAATISDLWRDFPDVKVIAISGGDAEAGPEEFLEYAGVFGALRTFEKPIGGAELLAAIRELLEA